MKGYSLHGDEDACISRLCREVTGCIPRLVVFVRNLGVAGAFQCGKNICMNTNAHSSQVYNGFPCIIFIPTSFTIRTVLQSLLEVCAVTVRYMPPTHKPLTGVILNSHIDDALTSC